MSESKHTPGPFEVQDPMGSADGLWIVQAGLEAYEWSCIAIVTRDEDRSGKHFITKAEQNANAALFAAAPTLLQAVKGLLEATELGLPRAFAEEYAEAAVKLAEAPQP